jgi:hypothetical protein
MRWRPRRTNIGTLRTERTDRASRPWPHLGVRLATGITREYIFLRAGGPSEKTKALHFRARRHSNFRGRRLGEISSLGSKLSGQIILHQSVRCRQPPTCTVAIGPQVTQAQSCSQVQCFRPLLFQFYLSTATTFRSARKSPRLTCLDHFFWDSKSNWR